MFRTKGITVCLVVMALVSCYGEYEYVPPVVVDTPLGKLEISNTGTSINVRPHEDAHGRIFKGDDLFGDFWPSITHRQAIDLFGEPLFVRRNGNGVYYYYRTESGVVEIAHEMTGSGSSSRSWVLCAYPDSTDANLLFDSAIAEYITSSVSTLHLTILNPDGTPGKGVIAKNGEVMFAIWVNLPRQERTNGRGHLERGKR